MLLYDTSAGHTRPVVPATLQLIIYTCSIISFAISARVMEVPKIKLKRSSISEEVACIDKAPTRNENRGSPDSKNPSSCSLVTPVPKSNQGSTLGHLSLLPCGASV